MPDKTKVCTFIIIGGLAGTVAGSLVEQAVLGLVSCGIGLIGAVLLPSRK